MSVRAIRRRQGGDRVQLVTNGYTDTAVDPTNSRVLFNLESDGDVFVARDDGPDGVEYQWLSPGTNSGNYEVEVVISSGSFTSSAGDGVGVWTNLGTNRQWTRQQTVVGSSSVVAVFSIRPTGGSVMASATITLTAEVDA